jgi:Zn-finger nucleic acid-binding protein
MKCPVDDTELAMTERHGIEVDYCPKCRGVWLDRGELDKIIDRAGAELEAPRAAAQPPREEARYREERYDRGYRDDHRGYRDDRHYGSHKPYKKRKSLLGEIFDFD